MSAQTIGHRMAHWWRSATQPLNDAWFRPDLRTLALFRIAYGLLVAVDVVRRMPYIALMYSDEGVLTNQSILEQPFGRYTFSLLLSLGSPFEATVFFWVILLSALCFIAGYRTKLAHIIVAIGVLSIHNKNILVENGGDQVMNIYAIWGLFLPLGQRWSVDALIQSMRNRREQAPEQLCDANFVPPAERRVWRLAYLGALVQLAVIYFFNTVSKSGETWAQGTAIYYLLEQDRQITEFGVWMRQWAPLWLSKIISFSTLVVEGMLPVLILMPLQRWNRRRLIGLGIFVLLAYASAVGIRFALFGRLQNQWPYALLPIVYLAPLVFLKSTRALAYLFVVGLHVGIAVVSNVGLFSWAMIAAATLLLTGADLDVVARYVRHLSRGPVLARVDHSVGLYFWLARLARRLDGFGLISWQAAEEPATALWVERSGQVFQGSAAIRALVEALPFGRILAAPLYLPGALSVMDMKGRVLQRADRARSWFAFPPAQVGVAAFVAPGSDAMSPARRAGNAVGAALRGGAVAFVMVACTIQMLNTNKFFTDVIPKITETHLGTKIDFTTKQPQAMQMWVGYTRMFQRWNMFAPNVPKSEGWMVIDAKLADGRRVDPQTGNPPIFGPVDATVGVDFGQMWRIYTKRIALKRYKHFRKNLKNYLLKRHRIEELPAEERIVSFDVWWIRDVSPKPADAERTPKETNRFKITSHHPGKKVQDEEESEDAPAKKPAKGLPEKGAPDRGPESRGGSAQPVAGKALPASRAGVDTGVAPAAPSAPTAPEAAPPERQEPPGGSPSDPVVAPGDEGELD